MRPEPGTSQRSPEGWLYAVAGSLAGCAAAVITAVVYSTWAPRVIAWWTQASEQVAQLN